MTFVAMLVEAVLQVPQPVSNPSGIDVSIALGGSATSSFLTTLLVGAIMVALAPEYTERMMAAVRDDIVGSFAYGITALLVVVLAVILPFISFVCIFLLIPFVMLAYVVWAVVRPSPFSPSPTDWSVARTAGSFHWSSPRR